MRTSARVLVAALAFVTLHSTPAHAGYPGRVGTRALGMGGALRGASTGDSGPMLNPSGMSLLRSYAVEGSYQLNDGGTDLGAHRAHLSIVDSTPQMGLAGGLYYTYLSADTGPNTRQTGHLAGLALSLPFGDRVLVGASLKYLRLSSTTQLLASDPMAPMEMTAVNAGFTTDVGTTVRATDALSIALVGYNLVNRETMLAPRALGSGVAFTPIPTLLLAVDAVMDMQSDKLRGTGDRNLFSYMGGVEFLTTTNIAVRGGGGRDGVRRNGYFSVGASALSEVGAIDVALQRDITGQGKETIFSVSARLFVPN